MSSSSPPSSSRAAAPPLAAVRAAARPAAPAEADGEPLFLAVCRGRVTARRPIWLMRQAGRILPPYRRLKESVGSIERMFRDPSVAARVTLMPVELLGVDAAILFADIFTPVDPMGCTVTFDPGPVLAFHVGEAADVARLRVIDSERDLDYVARTIGKIRDALPREVPLIGFAGAPLTLATYMAEGPGRGREFSGLRRMLHADPSTAHSLLGKLTDVTVDYLAMQVRAGVQALQLFDTWIGALSLADFEAVALPYLRRIFAHLSGLGVPTIYYAHNAAHLAAALDRVGADVLSVDWRTDLPSLFERWEGRIPLQGNLDPLALFAAPDAISGAALSLLQQTAGYPHIFNLGHGVHPDTPYESVERLVETVKAYAAPPAIG